MIDVKFLVRSISSVKPLLSTNRLSRKACTKSYSIDSIDKAVELQYDDYNTDTNPRLSPLVISHGMLGSRHNWTSIAKQLHRSTGKGLKENASK